MSRFSLKDLRPRQRMALKVVEPLLVAKRDHTLLKTYDRIAPGSDGRIHTILSPIGTTTFRLSSSESILFDGSTNLQNMANKVVAYDDLYKVRDCIVADEGKVFVALDYAGAEAVLVAAYSKDWDFLEKLLVGADVHSEHARAFFSMSLAEWDRTGGKKGNKSKRNIAKTITYSSFYYATPRTIAEKMNKDSDLSGVRVTEAEVAAHRAVLLQMHPLEAWWAETLEQLAKTGGITRNCFGYRRVFRDPDEHNRLKDALSTYAQSTVACLMNMSVNKVDKLERKDELEGESLLQIHDELLFQTTPNNVDNLIRTVKTIMEQRFVIHGRELYVPVEAKVGPTWGSMKEYH